MTGKCEEQVEITPHHSDIFPGVVKTRLFHEKYSDGTELLRKVYFSEMRHIWEREQLFNERVDETGYNCKPRLIQCEEDLQTLVEYFPSRNLEEALSSGEEIDFNALISLMLEESTYLRRAKTEGLVDKTDQYREVRRLLSPQSLYLTENEKAKLANFLELADKDKTLARIDPVLSNFIVSEEGDLRTIDYSSPIIAHPIHGPIYLAMHFDLPLRRSFFNVRDKTVQNFYNSLVPRIDEFIPNEEQREATIKATLINYFVTDWLGGENGKLFENDSELNSGGNPDLTTRIETLKKMINFDYHSILRGDIGFRKKL